LSISKKGVWYRNLSGNGEEKNRKLISIITDSYASEGVRYRKLGTPKNQKPTPIISPTDPKKGVRYREEEELKTDLNDYVDLCL
jgi:hypothetical protein